MKGDFYTRKAREEGLRARSAYKLSQINKKYNLIKKNDKVLDLGCWPGGWLLIAKSIVGERGYVLGIDEKQIKMIEGVDFIKADVLSDNVFDKSKVKFDVVISDLAPNTSGIIELDIERSYELSLRGLEIAKKVLKRNGNFLCKIFMGGSFNDFLKKVREDFEFVKSAKPDASKKGSKETYIVGKMFRD